MRQINRHENLREVPAFVFQAWLMPSGQVTWSVIATHLVL